MAEYERYAVTPKRWGYLANYAVFMTENDRQKYSVERLKSIAGEKSPMPGEAEFKGLLKDIVLAEHLCYAAGNDNYLRDNKITNKNDLLEACKKEIPGFTVDGIVNNRPVGPCVNNKPVNSSHIYKVDEKGKLVPKTAGQLKSVERFLARYMMDEDKTSPLSKDNFYKLKRAAEDNSRHFDERLKGLIGFCVEHGLCKGFQEEKQEKKYNGKTYTFIDYKPIDSVIDAVQLKELVNAKVGELIKEATVRKQQEKQGEPLTKLEHDEIAYAAQKETSAIKVDFSKLSYVEAKEMVDALPISESQKTVMKSWGYKPEEYENMTRGEASASMAGKYPDFMKTEVKTVSPEIYRFAEEHHLVKEGQPYTFKNWSEDRQKVEPRPETLAKLNELNLGDDYVKLTEKNKSTEFYAQTVIAMYMKSADDMLYSPATKEQKEYCPQCASCATWKEAETMCIANSGVIELIGRQETVFALNREISRNPVNCDFDKLKDTRIPLEERQQIAVSVKEAVQKEMLHERVARIARSKAPGNNYQKGSFDYCVPYALKLTLGLSEDKPVDFAKVKEMAKTPDFMKSLVNNMKRVGYTSNPGFSGEAAMFAKAVMQYSLSDISVGNNIDAAKRKAELKDMWNRVKSEFSNLTGSGTGVRTSENVKSERTSSKKQADTRTDAGDGESAVVESKPVNRRRRSMLHNAGRE